MNLEVHMLGGKKIAVLGPFRPFDYYNNETTQFGTWTYDARESSVLLSLVMIKNRLIHLSEAEFDEFFDDPNSDVTSSQQTNRHGVSLKVYFTLAMFHTDAIIGIIDNFEQRREQAVAAEEARMRARTAILNDDDDGDDADDGDDDNAA
jgi:hypothetical protein